MGTGSVLDPGSGTWTSELPTVLSPRYDHVAVPILTGTAMFVWGGFTTGNNPVGDGGIYTP